MKRHNYLTAFTYQYLLTPKDGVIDPTVQGLDDLREASDFIYRWILKHYPNIDPNQMIISEHDINADFLADQVVHDLELEKGFKTWLEISL